MAIPFTRDSEAKLHEEGAIRQICAPFRSHENGLPEWIKNSSDAYARIDASDEQRIIIVIFQQKKGTKLSVIGCLDFVGMDAFDIENRFRIWADPNAAGGDDIEGIQGGHGNGGKCYMTQMFNEYSMLHTVKNAKGNRYGFVGRSPIPGYFPNVQKGRDYEVKDKEAELEKALQELGLSIKHLPASAVASIKAGGGFTLVKGVDPIGVKNGKIPIRSFTESINNHQQMIRTIQICNVYVIADGEIINNEPLKLEEIEPLPEAKELKVIDIPETLIDPVTYDEVLTIDEEYKERGRLILRTSITDMRYRAKKFRHCIAYYSQKRPIGFTSMSEFSQQYFANRMYGECTLDILERFKLNERQRLAESPLTRAIEEWIKERVDEYVKEFIKIEKLKASQEQQEELKRINSYLNDWKNQFIKDFGIGAAGNLKGLGGGGGGKESLPNLPPEKLKVAIPYHSAGVNISFKPKIEFFGKDDVRVKPVPYRWHSADWNVATVDDELLVVTTHTPGITEIWAESLSIGLISNKVTLRVVKIKEIRIEPSHIQVPAGQRRKATAIVTLHDSTESDEVYLVWQENNRNIAAVTPIGMVYGLQQGKTEITAFDDNCMAKIGAIVEVLPEVGGGGENGEGYPQILLSEIDDDPLAPGTPVPFSPEEGTVCQRAQDSDANIWWINTAAPLARKFLNKSAGYGIDSKEWRVYHLERYIEALVQIKLNHAFVSGEELPYDTIERTWREEASHIQSKVISDLDKFIDEGEI
jgi:hypothetical protein